MCGCGNGLITLHFFCHPPAQSSKLTSTKRKHTEEEENSQMEREMNQNAEIRERKQHDKGLQRRQRVMNLRTREHLINPKPKTLYPFADVPCAGWHGPPRHILTGGGQETGWRRARTPSPNTGGQ